MTRLEFLRRQRGLTQTELGTAILYSRSIISILEHRRPNPEMVNVRIRAALERYFGESFHELMQPVSPGANQ
ncbi:MAG: XRE family transcriptional regulator [Thermodesulfobacteriota bacterium]